MPPRPREGLPVAISPVFREDKTGEEGTKILVKLYRFALVSLSEHRLAALPDHIYNESNTELLHISGYVWCRRQMMRRLPGCGQASMRDELRGGK